MQPKCNIGKPSVIGSEAQLSSVDFMLRGIAEHFLKIPYAATWGESCQGCFEDYHDSALIHPYGIISMILCQELPHIKELQEIFFSFKGKYSGLNIRSMEIENLGRHSDFSKVLESHECICSSSIIGSTKENYSIINLIIEQHDNGSMGPAFLPSVKSFTPKSSPFYNLGKKRYWEIEKNWLSMASEIGDYCQKHCFSIPDFSKKELEPFIQ